MNPRVALTGARAELAHAQRNLPSKMWHLATPTVSMALFWVAPYPADAIVLSIGCYVSLLCSDSILDKYDNEKRLEMKCAQLEAEAKKD